MNDQKTSRSSCEIRNPTRPNKRVTMFAIAMLTSGFLVGLTFPSHTEAARISGTVSLCLMTGAVVVLIVETIVRGASHWKDNQRRRKN